MVKHLKLIFIALFFFIAAGQFVWTSTQAQDQPAEKFFKNIQALKGVPAGQIAAIMDSYNKALGVSCEYCHVPGALEKGDKPAHKASVRDIQMTRDINERYKHAVNCMSCHQGKAKPTLTGAVIADNRKPEPTKPEPTKPEPAKPEPAKPEPSKPASGGTEPDPPGDEVVFRASFGRVPFPHARHMSAVSDCATCHHTGENNKCSTCHQKAPTAITKVRAQDAAHSKTSQRACAGCHLASKVGPTTCAACHKK